MYQKFEKTGGGIIVYIKGSIESNVNYIIKESNQVELLWVYVWVS